MRRPRAPTEQPPRQPGSSASPKKPNPLKLGRQRGPAPPKPTREESSDRRQWVQSLMERSGTLAHIIKEGAKKLPPLSPAQVLEYWRSIRQEEEEQREQDAATEKAAQLQQIRTEIMQMKSITPVDKIPWASVARHRKLIAEMTGTLAPVEIDVGVNVDIRVQHAVMAVVGNMSPSEIAHAAQEQRRLEREGRH